MDLNWSVLCCVDGVVFGCCGWGLFFVFGGFCCGLLFSRVFFATRYTSGHKSTIQMAV